jgi:ferrochelatase
VNTAILLSCHGTVERVDDLPAFLLNIRRGRPPSPEILAEVRHRFELIGGSPLMRVTRAQAAALEARLGVPVHVAARLWNPYPKDVVEQLVASGVRRIVSIPLAPQSTEIYNAAVREACAAHADVTLREAPAWGDEPALIDACVETVSGALEGVEAHLRARTPILLTAHSLPKRVIAAGDAYEREFRALASRVSDRLVDHGSPVRVAFQSQGMTGDEWLGPDLASSFDAILAERGTGVVIAPIGFVADHVETLYDLDIEARKVAESKGLRFHRATAFNDRPRFIDALEAVARRELSAFA